MGVPDLVSRPAYVGVYTSEADPGVFFSRIRIRHLTKVKSVSVLYREVVSEFGMHIKIPLKSNFSFKISVRKELSLHRRKLIALSNM